MKKSTKKVLPLFRTHADAAFNQIKSNSCTRCWNLILWNRLGCIPQTVSRLPRHLLLEATITQPEQSSRQLFAFSSLWTRSGTLNGTTTSVRRHKAPTLSLTNVSRVTVLCLSTRAELWKQGSAVLIITLHCCHQTQTKTRLLRHSSTGCSVKCKPFCTHREIFSFLAWFFVRIQRKVNFVTAYLLHLCLFQHNSTIYLMLVSA